MDNGSAEAGLRDRLASAVEEPFKGWDFSRLHGRLVTEALPWSYEEIVREAMGEADALLDMETGGGELLARLGPLPPRSIATEGYPPNVPLARARLEPLGVEVVEAEGESVLPFPDASFDLIINRHGAYRPEEIARLLQPGGRFITQQVGGRNLVDLNERLGTEERSYADWTAERALRELEDAGLRITTSQESFPASRFADVEAIVYLLRAVPWQVPDFTIDRYLDALSDIDQEIRERGFVEFHDHRFVLVARQRA